MYHYSAKFGEEIYLSMESAERIVTRFNPSAREIIGAVEESEEADGAPGMDVWHREISVALSVCLPSDKPVEWKMILLAERESFHDISCLLSLYSSVIQVYIRVMI